MSVKAQKEAVYEATRSTLNEKGIKFEDGQDAKPLIDTDMRKSIIGIVVAGCQDGSVLLKEGFDQSKLPTYTSGLVSNWLRKDKRLNGGDAYQTQNPGSRAGSSNPEIKEIRKLLKTVEAGSAAEEKIKGVLAEKIAEHKAKNQKKVEIDMDALPEALREYVK